MEKIWTEEEIAAIQKQVDDLASYYQYGFEPVESQLRFLQAAFDPKYMEVVLVAGRGWGKDLTLGMYLYELCTNVPNTDVLFVCPWKRQVLFFINQVLKGVSGATDKHFIPQGYHTQPTFQVVTSPNIEIRFPNGSKISGASTDNPNGIRGFRGNIVVLNEVSDIPFNVIATQIYPVIKEATKENDGKAPKIFWVGTPKGKNHLYKKFVEGLHNPIPDTKRWFDPTQLKSDCISFHMTKERDNPKSALNIKLVRPTMSQMQFDQEVNALFLDDSSVFMNLGHAFMQVDLGQEDINMMCNEWKLPPVKPSVDGNNKKPGHKYVAGLDLAKDNDWTVLTIMDCNTKKMAGFFRFNGMDFITQAEKILAITKEYNNAPILFDATGVGNAVSDILFDKNKNPDQALQGLVFTNDNKGEMIDKLKVLIQREKEWIAGIPVLQAELQALVVTRTKMGKPSYHAPANQHDDCVMSLALCVSLFLDEIETGEATIYVMGDAN